MPEHTLAKKLETKPVQRAAVIHAPEGCLEPHTPLPDGGQAG